MSVHDYMVCSFGLICTPWLALGLIQGRFEQGVFRGVDEVGRPTPFSAKTGGSGKTQPRALPVLLKNQSKLNPDAEVKQSLPRQSTGIDFYKISGLPTSQTLPQTTRTSQEIPICPRTGWDDPPSPIILSSLPRPIHFYPILSGIFPFSTISAPQKSPSMPPHGRTSKDLKRVHHLFFGLEKSPAHKPDPVAVFSLSVPQGTTKVQLMPTMISLIFLLSSSCGDANGTQRNPTVSRREETLCSQNLFAKGDS